MTRDRDWQVEIIERGREGEVVYREPGHELRCYWEFGGNDVIAIVSVGREADWRERHPWTAGRRAEIVWRIAEEVVRQKVPTARAELDEARGALYLRGGSPGPTSPPRSSAPPPRAGAPRPATPSTKPSTKPPMKLVLAGVLLAVALIAIVARSLLTIKTSGAPWGSSARIGDTIITLMTRLEPYVPSLHRNPANDRYTVGLLLHSARDPSVRRFVTVATGRQGSRLGLTKLTGADGDIIRFQAPEPGGYDLRSGKLIDAAGLPPRARTASLSDYATGDRALLGMLTSGSFPSPDRWLGILSESDAAASFKPNASVSHNSPLERSREPRRLYLSAVDRSLDGKPRVVRLEQLPGEGMLNAAFVRDRAQGETLRLDGGGFLLVYESKPNRAGTIMVSRVDFDGKVTWTLDTGIGELREVLPDPATPALIGDRPRIPDKVPEPVLVIVDAAKGTLSTRSLWLK